MKVKINYEHYRHPHRGDLIDQSKWYGGCCLVDRRGPVGIHRSYRADGDTKEQVRDKIIQDIYADFSEPEQLSEEVELNLCK